MNTADFRGHMLCVQKPFKLTIHNAVPGVWQSREVMLPTTVHGTTMCVESLYFRKLFESPATTERVHKSKCC